MTQTEPLWQAVAERRRAADGAFVYAVKTTGIYCRPSCPSRRPQPDRVEFFLLPEAAERAGYRPCRRCRPDAVPLPIRSSSACARRAARSTRRSRRRGRCRRSRRSASGWAPAPTISSARSRGCSASRRANTPMRGASAA